MNYLLVGAITRINDYSFYIDNELNDMRDTKKISFFSKTS